MPSAGAARSPIGHRPAPYGRPTMLHAADDELLLTARGTVLAAGATWAALLGWPRQDLELLDVAELVTPAQRPLLRARLDAPAPRPALALRLRHAAGHEVRAVLEAERTVRRGHDGPLLALRVVRVPGDRALTRGAVHAAWRHRRFALWAQPILDATTLEVVRHELLLRLVTEEGDVLPAGRVLPVLERLGLTAEVDRWVVGCAAGLQPALGAPLEVNLGAATLAEPDALMRTLELALKDAGTDPAQLVLALPCAAVLEDLPRAAAFVDAVGALGCRTAIDGIADEAELDALHALPVDVLKLTPAAATEPIVAAAARSTGRLTSAEAIDNADSLFTLRLLGVQHAQGYHLAPPVVLRGVA
jgi:EAL domain-containing protein (putative c-di-GMP-specific phosphodiesterase class I)